MKDTMYIPTRRRLPEKIEITLYRIFQELIHNIIKHSQATEVLVQLRKMSNHILLVVEDNGRGLTEEKNPGHRHQQSPKPGAAGGGEPAI